MTQLTEEQVACLEGCRSYAQYERMRSGFENGYCEFCNLDTDLNSVIWENTHVCCWAVPKQFLRTELAHHFIIIPKRHVRFPEDLHAWEVLGMHRARMFIFKEHSIAGGALVTRFGDMRLNAGTVPHMHENIMVPNCSGEVRVPLYKDPADREENRRRAEEFALKYLNGD